MTALRAPQIAVFAADTGPLQMSLFDEQSFAGITHPDYPGERLVACRNPALADLRGRNRLDLLRATEQSLAPTARGYRHRLLAWRHRGTMPTPRP